MKVITIKSLKMSLCQENYKKYNVNILPNVHASVRLAIIIVQMHIIFHSNEKGTIHMKNKNKDQNRK